MFGNHGSYLRVDLTRNQARRVPIPESVLRRYLGGVGLGAWLLHREAPPGVDPLAPEAPLVFAFSPLVGTPFTTSAKFAVVAKSPLTGMICDALSSSFFALAGKKMGVDALVFVGRCAEPSEWVAGELRPTRLWGLEAGEAEQRLGEQGRAAVIGPAGERGVRFASLSNGGRHAGRGGLGAVLGAKRLKAVVVRGERSPELADPRAVARQARSLARRSLGPETAKYRYLGTAANVASFDRIGALPTRNFRQGSFPSAPALAAETLQAERGSERRSCASCTIGCEHRYRGAGGESTRVEYESLFALGSLCGVGDAEAVLAASRRCDALGLDTISTGGTIAFAMECRERGLLPEAPAFGDAEGMLALIEAIACRQGLGALLSLGSRQAALELGGDCLDFAPQVKGLELPGYEPRALQSMALGLAVGTRGADHNRSAAYELDFSGSTDRLRGSPDTARRSLEPEDRAALLDSLILCKFLRGALGDVFAEAADMLRAVTGWDTSADELRAVARRVVHLRKAFNIREGWQPRDDTLPPRLLSEGLPSAGGVEARLPASRLREMVTAYNEARGWTRDGYLPPGILEELRQDLGFVGGPAHRECGRSLWDPDLARAASAPTLPRDGGPAR